MFSQQKFILIIPRLLDREILDALTFCCQMTNFDEKSPPPLLLKARWSRLTLISKCAVEQVDPHF